MKKTLATLAMVLILLAVFSVKSTFAAQASALWCEDSAVNLYRDPPANSTKTIEVWTLHGERSRLFWREWAQTWGHGWYPNFGISQQGEWVFPFNNADPNLETDTYWYRRYTLTWGQGLTSGGLIYIDLEYNVPWYWYPLLAFLGEYEDIPADCSKASVCVVDEYCDKDAGETFANCPADCKSATTTTILPTTTTTTPPTTTVPAACPLVSINNAVVQLLEGYMINGQLNFNQPWYDQFPNTQNQITLNCTYSGEWLEFSVCKEANTGDCPEPCDNQYRINTDDPNHHNWHYGYLCP